MTNGPEPYPWGHQGGSGTLNSPFDNRELAEVERLSGKAISDAFKRYPSPRVVVISMNGQSNGEGRALPAGPGYDFEDSRILMWDWPTQKLATATVPLSSRQAQVGFSVATAIARNILEREAVTAVVIVNGGVGGSSLAGDGASGVWRVDYAGVNPALYVPARNATLMAIEDVIDLFGVVPEVRAFWHQGEADSNGPAYQAALDALITQLRTDLALPDLTFTLGGIVPEYLVASPTRVPIRAVHVDTPRRMLRTGYADGIPNGGGSASVSDIVHYHRVGAEALGAAMYEASLRAAANTTASVPTPPLEVTAEFDGNQISVEWKSPLCRVTGYVVEISVDGSAFAAITHTTIETVAKATGIAGSQVRVRVSTVNGATTSAPSSPVVAVPVTAPEPVPGFLATFDQPDGPIQATNDGKGWEHIVPSGTRLPLVVVSGEAAKGVGGSSSRTLSVVESHLADGHIQAIVGGLGDSSGSIVFRVVDSNNYIRVSCRADATTRQYRIIKRVAGTETTVASTGSVTSAANDVIDVVMAGTSITVSINGVVIFGGAKVVAEFPTATKHGILLQAASTGAETWKSMLMEAA